MCSAAFVITTHFVITYPFCASSLIQWYQFFLFVCMFLWQSWYHWNLCQLDASPGDVKICVHRRLLQNAPALITKSVGRLHDKLLQYLVQNAQVISKCHNPALSQKQRSTCQSLNFYVHVSAVPLNEWSRLKIWGDCLAGRSSQGRSRDKRSVFQST